MGTTTKGYTPTTGAIPTAAQWNAMVDPIYTEVNGLLDENNVAWADSDGIVTVQQTQSISGAKTFSNAAGVVVNYGLNLGGTSASASAWGLAGINLEAKAGTYTDSSTSGSATATNAAVNSFAVPTLAATNSSVTTTYASTVYIAGAPAAGTNQTLTNAYALWVDAGATQLDGTLTTGVDDTGVDVKFFGATSGQYLLWDESADELVLTGDSKLSFHDAAGGENIIASADGHLEVNAGTTLDMSAPTVDINGTTTVTIDGGSSGFSIDGGAASNLATSAGALTITSAVAATWSTTAGDLTITAGGGDISFDNENLSTTGTLASGALTVTGAILPNADNGGALGASGTEFSDLFLHSGGVINWEASNVTIVQSPGTLTVTGNLVATDLDGIIGSNTAAAGTFTTINCSGDINPVEFLAQGISNYGSANSASYDDTQTVTMNMNGGLLFVVTDANTGHSGVFFANYNSATIVELADPATGFRINDDTDDGNINVFKSVNSQTISVVNNKGGSAHSLLIHTLGQVTSAAGPS